MVRHAVKASNEVCIRLIIDLTLLEAITSPENSDSLPTDPPPPATLLTSHHSPPRSPPSLTGPKAVKPSLSPAKPPCYHNVTPPKLLHSINPLGRTTPHLHYHRVTTGNNKIHWKGRLCSGIPCSPCQGTEASSTHAH